MDEDQTRQAVQAHADAVVRGDMDHVINDFTEELRPQVPELAKGLPLPASRSEVRSLTVGADESVAEILYVGESGEATIRSHWQDVDGRPQIVAGEPI